jgi:hypothetical protein
LKLEVEQLDRDQAQPWNDLDVLEDQVMDVEMSAKGAHQMITPLKEDVWVLNNVVFNLSN